MKITEEGAKQAIVELVEWHASHDLRAQAIRAVENCAIGNTVSLETMMVIAPWCMTNDYIEFPKRPEMPSPEKWTAEGIVDFEPMPTVMFHIEKWWIQPFCFKPGYYFFKPKPWKTLWRRVR